MKKIIFFLAVSVISLGFLWGGGKEARGWVENCNWIYYGTLYQCIINPGDGFCLPGGGFGYRNCSDNATCWGNTGTAYHNVYYNSCTGSAWCDNVPEPPKPPRCHYIYEWNCGENPKWTYLWGSDCSDVGAPICCTPENASLSGWSGCSVTCGGGTQTRTCSGAYCGGSTNCGGAALSQSCNTQPCCTPNCGDTSQRCTTETWDDGCGNNICRGTKDCSIDLTLSASPNPVKYGIEPSTLTWTPRNATSCSATGDWSGDKSASGSTESTGNLIAAKTYNMECKNPYNTVNRSVTVNVTLPPAPVISLIADTPINKGESATLTWTTDSNAAYCWASNSSWSGWKTNTGGTEEVSPDQTTTYKMKCSNIANIESNEAEATVCVRDCSCKSETCDTKTCSDTCGGVCQGTLPPNTCAGNWSNCSKSCGGGTQTQSCVCPTKTETRTCNSHPCPPGYREVAPW